MLGYFEKLTDAFGRGWNRFWFTPSDPYTLSVLRIFVGLVALYNVFTYSFDLERLFGPAGILPSELIQTLLAARSPADANYHFSYLDDTFLDPVFLTHVRNNGELWTLHLLSMAVLVLFTIGFYTRITSVLALLVVLSYSHRAIFLTNEFEGVLTFMMLYICLGASGACLSVDSWRAKKAGPPAVQASYSATISVRLIQVHLTVVYVMMLLGQLSAPVWWNGQAAWWLALNTQDALVDLTGLASHVFFFNFLTHLIIAYELAFPLLVWNPLARPLMLGLGLIVWSVVAVLTGLVTFCLLMLIANLAFIPGIEMRQLCSRLLTRRPQTAAATAA
jgi:hypothetical protein